MNPVISYRDFMQYMARSSNNHSQLLPVVLIKPSTLLYLNREYRLDHLFDYFDRRTGNEVQFFLPGYSHYPSTSFLQSSSILPEIKPYNQNAVALNLTRLKKVYYSDNDFLNFVEILEQNAQNFRYYGNTELLFIKYIPGRDSALGRFDFSNIHRYNLSQIYYDHQEHFYHVERILEEVLHVIRFEHNETELIALINNILD